MNWIILAGLAAFFLATAFRDGGDFWSFGYGGSMELSTTVGDRRLRISAEGDVDLEPDGSGVAGIADGGYLDVRERRNGVERRVRFEGNGGAIERKFWDDGDEQPWDQAADRYVAEIVPILLRETGISAPERVAWLVENRGHDGLIDEIDLIESDFVQQLYTVEYAEETTIPEAAFSRLAGVAKTGISSDFSLRIVLARLYETQRPTAANLAALIDAATTIDSDFEARLLLDAVTEAALDTPDAVAAFFRVADSIDSDFELRLALTPIASRRDVADDVVEQAMETAGRRLSSDFELRILLGAAAERVGASDALAEAYLTATDSIGSDFEMRLALSTLADEADLSVTGWEMLLMSAQDLDGDFECTLLLTSVADRLPDDERVVAAYRAAVDTIDSDFERNRAESALRSSTR